MPSQIRSFVHDFTNAQLEAVRAQKKDEEFPLFDNLTMDQFLQIAIAMPTRAHEGIKIRELVEKYGVTTLNWKPLPTARGPGNMFANNPGTLEPFIAKMCKVFGTNGKGD